MGSAHEILRFNHSTEICALFAPSGQKTPP